MRISKRAFLFTLLTVLSASLFTSVIFAQSAARITAQTGTSLEAEIQNLERSVNRQGIAASERHEALVRLARLRQLSGDIEGAARNWLDAARAIPGSIDDEALLNCAYCLAAMGEWERSRTALEPLLSKSPRARFLNFSITAITTGNAASLAAIADNGEYDQMKSEIYFLLWRISTGPVAERWRQRLVNEFPQSPEARLASGGQAQSITLRQSPFWLFMGGLDSLAVLPSQGTGNREQRAGNREQRTESREQRTETTPAPTATAPAATAPTQPPVQSYVRLQTGIFSRQENAQNLANRLRQAGFTPTIEERMIGSDQMWAVTVPQGADQGRTLADLKEKGFDAFPLR